jgi:hypothetical protein
MTARGRELAVATRFCPRCGTPRVGNFRYCRSCQLDFDGLDTAPAADASVVPPASVQRVASPVVTAPAPPAPESKSSSGETIFTGAIAIVLVIAMVVLFVLIITGTLTATG